MSESSLVELAEAVRAAAENRARQRQLAVQLETTEALVATRRDELAQLHSALQVELSEVRRLEEASLTKLWATLRGNTADRLAIERAEADVAAIAVASAQSRLDSAIAEDARVRREHDALQGADRSYADALAAYETAVLAVGGRDAEELTALAEQLGVTQARHREVAEAVDALRAARTALDTALAKLDSAGGWSTYDTFFGGGLVADMVKHSSINDATEAFREVNRALERLSVELADIGGAAIDGVEVSETLAVFDVLFDNIVSDWMVRERISEAKARAEDLRRRLSQLAGELDGEAVAISTRVTELLGRREEILRRP
ncbi:hypothetical protein Lsed01_00382 [Demequina sediminis]|uniref:Uncharacterized protein n=1 Tax=Demequina sediminis TaxID=1930058 RepID=A0ABP9WGS9_9MICO|nr:hypothetical protein [Demequina sediminis]BDZ61079.1 hypothetical protein GCM10025873_08700 [Demequina sediminis]